jgi:DNA-binding transcriptional MerR regulator
MGVEKRFFTQGEICEIVGVTRRQIQYWTYTGLLTPRFKTQGGHARYTFGDLVAYKTAKKLLDAGISIQRLRKSLTTLQGLLPKIKSPLNELTLVATGEVVLVLYENTLFEALSGQEWIINLSDLQRDVEKWQERSQRLRKFKRKNIPKQKEEELNRVEVQTRSQTESA